MLKWGCIISIKMVLDFHYELARSSARQISVFVVSQFRFCFGVQDFGISIFISHRLGNRRLTVDLQSVETNTSKDRISSYLFSW